MVNGKDVKKKLVRRRKEKVLEGEDWRHVAALVIAQSKLRDVGVEIQRRKESLGLQANAAFTIDEVGGKIIYEEEVEVEVEVEKN